MTGTLQKMFERIARLPDPVQNEVTARIGEMLDELENRAWEDAFADSASDAFFAAAEAEVAQAEREGKLIPLFPTIAEEE